MANPYPPKGPAPAQNRQTSPVLRNLNHDMLPKNNKYHGTDDGDDLIMSFRVPSDVLKRLKARAGKSSIDQYIYENIVYRATIDHVY